MLRPKFWIRRIVSLLRPGRVRQEIAEELQFHIDQQTREKMAAGVSPEEARRQARLSFGGITQIEEQGFDARGGGWFEALYHDLRYGIRVLGRSPAFAITAILTLALGIGVNSALFAIIKNVLIRPLPFSQPDRLVMVREQSGPSSSDAGSRLSGPDFNDIHDQSHTLQSVTAALPNFTYTLTGEGDPRNVKCTAITYDFFPTLGIRPFKGRLYTPAEYHVDGGEVVISYRFWKEQLGGDPNVIGRILKLQGDNMPVIGVMPDLPDLYPETDVWAKNIPELEFMHWRQNKFLSVIARLQPGVTRQQTEKELTAILRRAPGQPSDLRVSAVPLKDELVGNVKTPLKIVMGAVLLVLLITSVNLLCLLLARASDRSTEVAMRLSLGASTARITRQFVTENLILLTTGTTLGLGFAALLLTTVRDSNLGNLPRSAGLRIDSSVLLLALAVTLVLSLLLALGPARLYRRLNLNSVIKTGKGATARPRAFRVLVIAEMSCAIVLLVGAGLLLRSLWLVEHVNPGFEPEHILTTYLRTGYYSAEGAQFFDELLRRLKQAPGIQNTSVADCLPGSRASTARLQFDDRPNDPVHPAFVDGCWASADIFTTLGATLEQGRYFTPHDNARSAPVVIVSDSLAREYWPGENPIGKRIAISYTGPGRRSTGNPRFRTVVGVIEDLKLRVLDAAPNPALYMPFLQDETNHVFAGVNLFVRTTREPVWSADTVRREIRAFKPDQTINRIVDMNSVLVAGLAPRRFSAGLLGSFAGLALLLSAVGIYGTLAFSVAQRRREMGIRMALGASRPKLLNMIVGEGLTLAIAGAGIGIILSLLSMRIIQSLLFHISPFDPLAFAGSALLLMVVAASACFLPARRAASTEPVEVLRAE
jgi:putative ABC transport system permease protein